ncbi:hypothetical protein [Jeongeupia naejangsanensis]|uniref:DUF4375 domain-containing protein n=1 Tax=Jeongeupia naejangsanensis TaxID=613195 RepID=A0ABS2BFM4_9NEIS|nr:hypothetical protein [Jeongeupia naejangsanensis]MBM3114419.1 hypothetical protein [Jeongeupia naejangsanensis]
MQQRIHELFDLLADGGLDAADLDAMATEVDQAAADAETYLAADAASGYPAFKAQLGEAAMPLWQWVLLEQLEGGLVFRGHTAVELYAEIVDAFGEDELELAPDALAGLDEAGAWQQVSAALAPAYTPVDFAQAIDARRQIVLVRSAKLDRFLALSREIGLTAHPAV